VRADALERYTTYLRLQGLSPATIYGRRRLLLRLAAALPVPLLAATPPMLTTWRQAMTHTPAVIAGYVSHARCFYTWAVLEGLRDDDPTARIPVPRKPRRLPRPIPGADLADALAAAPPQIRLWLILAAWCGLRCKEIALLRAEMITASGAHPQILVAHDATKGHSERVIALAPFAAAELTAAGLPARGWAFPRADGRPGPNQPYRVSQMINAYLHSLGITATAHRLRHWFATEALAVDGNLRQVQELLGHASVASTQIYTFVRPAGAAATVAALPVPEQLRAAG